MNHTGSTLNAGSFATVRCSGSTVRVEVVRCSRWAAAPVSQYRPPSPPHRRRCHRHAQRLAVGRFRRREEMSGEEPRGYHLGRACRVGRGSPGKSHRGQAGPGRAASPAVSVYRYNGNRAWKAVAQAACAGSTIHPALEPRCPFR